jgi:hypothetical protein
MGVGGQRHAPSALSLGKRPVTHCTGGWVGLGAVLDGCGKSGTPQPTPTNLETCNLQPVARHRTGYGIPAAFLSLMQIGKLILSLEGTRFLSRFRTNSSRTRSLLSGEMERPILPAFRLQ